MNKCRTQVLIGHRECGLCTLLIVELVLQADTGYNRILGLADIPKISKTIQEKLTTYNISTECFKSVHAGLWPV